MSGGFQVGDVVVCVDASCAVGIRLGGTYRIEDVDVAPAGWGDAGTIGVILEGVRSDTVSGGYRASRFRKLDAPRTEIAERIRACKPQQVPA